MGSCIRLQDLPDLAVQVEDVDEKQPDDDLHKTWECGVKRYLDGQSVEEEKRTKIQRVQGTQHIVAWDNALQQVGIIGGIAQFCTPRDTWGLSINDLPLVDAPQGRLPCLVLALDQGPQSFPTSWFLLYHMHLNGFVIFDIYHRFWNDVKDALADCGLWTFVQASVVVMNLDFGPWDGSEFFERAATSLRHFLANATPSHPLFLRFFSQIMQDAGNLEGDVSLAARTALFESLKDLVAFSRKMKRVCLSRWFGWHDSAKVFLKVLRVGKSVLPSHG